MTVGRRKVYVEGSRPGVRVPFAEVDLVSDPPVRLYDTSGPGSDPSEGLPPAGVPPPGGVESAMPVFQRTAGGRVAHGRPPSRSGRTARRARPLRRRW